MPFGEKKKVFASSFADLRKFLQVWQQHNRPSIMMRHGWKPNSFLSRSSSASRSCLTLSRKECCALFPSGVPPSSVVGGALFAVCGLGEDAPQWRFSTGAAAGFGLGVSFLMKHTDSSSTSQRQLTAPSVHKVVLDDNPHQRSVAMCVSTTTTTSRPKRYGGNVLAFRPSLPPLS